MSHIAPSSRGARQGPILLGPNQPADRPYRGGAGIARFRGSEQPSEFVPEDFVASTTEVFAGGGVGLTTLPNGRLLRDAITADPTAWLGEAHLNRFGADPALLVKLLDTGERLFVHYHPDARFAAEHLGRNRGKTEAWIILEATAEACAWLGFTRDVEPDELAGWVAANDVAAMLAAMNRIPVRAGDTIFVPAQLPHAIGPGITLVELQEPEDLSVLLERRDSVAPDAARLGLDAETALSGVDRHGWSPDDLATLLSSRITDAPISSYFPAQADAFFRAELVSVSGELELDPGFSVLVVISGTGEIRSTAPGIPPLQIRRGDTVLIPFCAGGVRLSGAFEVIECRPPQLPSMV